MDRATVKILIGVLILALYFGKALFSNVKKQNAVTARRTAPQFAKMQDFGNTYDFKDGKAPKVSYVTKSETSEFSEISEPSEISEISESSEISEGPENRTDIRQAVIWSEILKRKF